MTGAFYVIRLLYGGQEELRLSQEEVMPFAMGFAAALGERQWLYDNSEPGTPEDTRRLLVMQLGDFRGWWKYLYLDTSQVKR